MSLPRKKQAERTRPRRSRRKLIFAAIIGTGLGLLVLLWVFIPQLWEKLPVQESPVASIMTANQEQSDQKPAEAVRERPLKHSKERPVQRAAKPGPDKAEKAVSIAYPSGFGNGARAEKDDTDVQGLISALSQAKLETLTSKTLPAIDRILQELLAQGKEALPAIRQFLESGEDLNFTEVLNVDELPDYRSIRLGLFDVLRKIGGPEAEDILLAELQNTYSPPEINALTKSLEEMAPAQYLDVAVAAAQDTLAVASEGQVAGKEVSLLFQVLQTHGDAAVVTDLEDSTEQWGYYATVALAGLRDSEGIPTLIEMVRQRQMLNTNDRPVQSNDIYADERLFALQMLAQVAIQQPDAHVALIEQTGANRIPDNLWPKIGLALAGQYQFQNEKPKNNELLQMVSDSAAAEDISFPHIIGKNGQVLYIKNRYGLEKLPPEEIQARLKIINDLLSVSPSLAADRALNHARSLLLKNKTKS